MNKSLILVAAFGLASISACKPISTPDQSQSAPSATAANAANAANAASPAPARKRAPVVTPERIAEITASGRKGFWSNVSEVCPSDRPLSDATLTWNVTDSGVKRVVVYLIDPKRDSDGKGRHLGGPLGPVGERTTGHWLRPGMIFKLRSRDDDKELGSIIIGEKPC